MDRPLFEGAHKDWRLWVFVLAVIGAVGVGGGLLAGAIKWEEVVRYGSIPAILLLLYGIKRGLDD